MKTNKLIFINVSPDSLHFRWQQEVLITNFRKFGISDQIQILVWYREEKNELQEWKSLEHKYPEVGFYYYPDEGVNSRLYEPQLRPHTLKKHFLKYKSELKGKEFFYHDCDIIFRELPDFELLTKGRTCWQSDCSSYLDYDYLRRKEIQGNMPEEEAIKALCTIGKIPVDTMKKYNKRTGGAQVLLKGIDHLFWKDVERISIDIRNQFFYNVKGSINRKYFRTEADGFQSWCADMWALNFALWNRGIKTDIHPELDFSWATSPIEAYHQRKIMHNAGVTGANPFLFNKGAWKKESPIGKPLPMPPANKSSVKYVEAILEVK